MIPLIISVDPGKTTGWAIRIGEEEPQSGQLPWYDFLDWIDAYIQAAVQNRFDVTIVCESFIITPQTIKKSRQHWSLEAIGCLKYWSVKYLRKELVLQSPSDGKSFSTDDKLKNLKWYKPGNVHANDALRHLLLYLVTKNQIDLSSVIQ